MTDDLIQSLAIAMCEKLDLNPYENVPCGANDTLTPGEISHQTSTFVPDINMYAARWELLRGQAAVALAAHLVFTEMEHEQ